jgi:hypothetical protein
MVATVQLRRYELVPAGREAFLQWWQGQRVSLRKTHGFVHPVGSA